jgi:hypothetical protein
MRRGEDEVDGRRMGEASVSLVCETYREANFGSLCSKHVTLACA